MKKIIVFVLFTLLLTGCEASYNLSMDLDSIHEETDMIVANGDEYSTYVDSIGPIYDYYIRNNIPLFTGDGGALSYRKDFEFDNYGGFSFNLLGDFDKDSFVNSYIINFAGVANTETTGNTVSFSYNFSSDLFENYSMLDKITINVNDINNNITSNNADGVNINNIINNEESLNNNTGKVYTWVITKDNYMDKTINFSYKKNRVSVKKIVEEYEKNSDNPMFKFSVILIVIVFIIFIIYKLFVLKFKSKNSI